MTTAHKITHYLLYAGDSAQIASIAEFLGIEKEEILNALNEVQTLLSPLHLELIQHKETLAISIDKTTAKKFHAQENKELVKPLSDSALQTLAVIIYKDGATKAEVDFVRGVDSGRSLKTLILRGLIERENLKNKKVYSATLDTLTYMNVDALEKLPNFESINANLRLLLDQE
jgi:segregation and condensation protein B